MVGLDLYRILAVLFVFLFHSHMHLQCEYGILTSFIKMGAIYMTAFFILSGFSLFMTWQYKDLHDIKTIKHFYCKRLVGILPLYYSVALLYIFLLGKENIQQNLLLAPVEILGIQSNFNTLFSVTHNGGTWFVSCILMCYLAFPIMSEIIKQISIRAKVRAIIVACFILLYSPILVAVFKMSDIYSNPFFRSLEFFIGAVICSLMPNIKKLGSLCKYLFSWWGIIAEHTVLICGVTLAVSLNISVGNFMLYNWIALPMFMLLIISMSEARFSYGMYESRVIKYLCEISYAFFFAQFFTWKTTIFVMERVGIESNAFKIAISFFVCAVYSILLHETIEKPLKKMLLKILNKYI
ncbi:acyltransferase [Butyrivibrio fibrisolvens]|uniref:acyltransferase family protein n=1 Tax=Butyrivibrio fibrisolvens TaxID=831 RepID=UPI002E8DD7FC|nr:acyltransferase [Butyrivibrio fibrisolvens]